MRKAIGRERFIRVDGFQVERFCALEGKQLVSVGEGGQRFGELLPVVSLDDLSPTVAPLVPKPMVVTACTFSIALENASTSSLISSQSSDSSLASCRRFSCGIAQRHRSSVLRSGKKEEGGKSWGRERAIIGALTTVCLPFLPWQYAARRVLQPV